MYHHIKPMLTSRSVGAYNTPALWCVFKDVCDLLTQVDLEL